MTALGVRLDPIPQLSAQDSIALARLAESLGYDMIWVPEGGGTDSLTRLAAFATATNRVRLGTGILPVFSRTPALTAMSALGMDLISNHRFTLGLGVGHQGSVEGVHGIPFQRPVTRIKETIDIVKRLLSGDEVSYPGKVFNVKKADLGFNREFHVPIYIAALGPRMVELAGEVADGVLLNWAAPSYLERALEHLRRGAHRAGRDPEEIDVACYIRVAVTIDDDLVRAPLRQQILRYSGMGYYKTFFANTGFDEETEAIERYLVEGDRVKAALAVSDDMMRQLAVFGGLDFCRKEINKRRSMGINMPVIAPFATGGALNSYRSSIEGLAPAALDKSP